MAQKLPDAGRTQTEILGKVDSLTVFQPIDPSLPAQENVNHVRIYCPHHDVAKLANPHGGVAIPDFGTLEELRNSIDDVLTLNDALGIDDSTDNGYLMAFIDGEGKLRPAYSLKQAAEQARNFKSDEALKGLSKRDPRLIGRINNLYVSYCFGNS